MRGSQSPVLITVATPTKKEAMTIARTLLEETMIACANILGPMQSLYAWKGKVEHSEEYLLVCKTLSSSASDTLTMIEEMHSYECPVIEVIECAAMNDRALRWLTKNLGGAL